MYQDGCLTFKEFLISLAVGYLMGFMSLPTPGGAEAAASVTSPVVTPSACTLEDVRKSLLDRDGRAIAYAFNMCLEAYMQFDVHHRGVIHKDELEQAMTFLASRGAGSGLKSRADHPVASDALHFLTEERFAELDFDNDGTCTFREFLFAMFSWVGIDDDDEEEDEDEEAGGAAAGGGGGGAAAGGGGATGTA